MVLNVSPFSKHTDHLDTCLGLFVSCSLFDIALHSTLVSIHLPETKRILPGSTLSLLRWSLTDFFFSSLLFCMTGFLQAFSYFTAFRGKALCTDFFSTIKAHWYIRNCTDPPPCQKKFVHLGTPPGPQLLLSNFDTSRSITSTAKDVTTMTVHHETSLPWKVRTAGVAATSILPVLWPGSGSALPQSALQLCMWSCVLAVRGRVAENLLELDKSLVLLLVATHTDTPTQLWQPGTCNTYRNTILHKLHPSLATLIPFLLQKETGKKETLNLL